MALERFCAIYLIAAAMLFWTASFLSAADADGRFIPDHPRATPACVPTCEKHGDGITPDQFLEAARIGSHSTIRKALAQGMDINVQNEFGESALHLVKDVALARYIISSGANVNLPDRQSGMAPLFFQDVPVAKVLISAGADVNARSFDGNTPLIWFAYSNYLEGVKYLVSNGADIHAVNKDGKTALDVAEHFGNRKVADYLHSLSVERNHQK